MYNNSNNKSKRTLCEYRSIYILPYVLYLLISTNNEFNFNFIKVPIFIKLI